MNKNTLVKNTGQVFTPQYIVCNMLDFCAYRGESILNKHIMDNSCGDGAFLKEITERYIKQALSLGYGIEKIKSVLETYIHGMEIEKETFNSCIENLNIIAGKYQINKVKWDVRNENSLSLHDFDGAMDFVVGNPPYVRVHNLNEKYKEIKRFSFASSGMTDLFLVFYELGFRMLNKKGKLCYITPSSWLNSLAGKKLRQFIKTNYNLKALVDLEHFQPFNATAYTHITLFDKEKKDNFFSYHTFDKENLNNVFKEKLSLTEIDIEDKFYLAGHDKLQKLRL